MRLLPTLCLTAAAGILPLPAQQPSEQPQTCYQILYLDRLPNAAEVAGVEGTDRALEPRIYYLAPSETKRGQTEFVPLDLAFARPSQTIRLPNQQPLELFAKASLDTRIATVPASVSPNALVLFRASRDKGFSDAKTSLLANDDRTFSFGTLRIINATERPAMIRTLDAPITLGAGETKVLVPTRGRRDNIPLAVALQHNGAWKQIHAGAIKLPPDFRATLLVTGSPGPNGGAVFRAETLLDRKRVE